MSLILVDMLAEIGTAGPSAACLNVEKSMRWNLNWFRGRVLSRISGPLAELGVLTWTHIETEEFEKNQFLNKIKAVRGYNYEVHFASLLLGLECSLLRVYLN